MKYKWVRNALGGLSAQVVGEELEVIQIKQGVLTPEIVLQEARLKRSKIHTCFEWDDAAAAHQFRLDTARYMLRSIQVVIESGTENEKRQAMEVRAFHHVQSDEGQTVYVTLNQARENEVYWRQVKADALSEIQAWQKKYKDICEFEVVFEAIAQIA